ncbi:phosphoribosyl-AMP cyclohydrolase [Lachnospiraceae bacterium KM106-2]|nr:phosphoribosyl-AMP cyclohydrolase [Lachnospiraceae bacterium KM106-2]
MSCKKIIPFINAREKEQKDVLDLAVRYANEGADELYIYNYTKDEAQHESFIRFMIELMKEVDIPVLMGLHVKKLEDVKKALYTGAHYVVINYNLTNDKSLIKEATSRFGEDKILVELDYNKGNVNESVIKSNEAMKVFGFILKHVTISDEFDDVVNKIEIPVIVRDSLHINNIVGILSYPQVIGIASDLFENKNILKVKSDLLEHNIPINTYESTMKFSEFKLNSDGLIPVVTQDYQTNEVLMVAYMNEEAFDQTISTGKMTYFSRSRQKLWIKGETSGHFQYVKSLTIDCDNDTMLAKVKQIGAACHTGNRSCFFTELVKKEYDDTNPLTVFQDVYDVIMDRKSHPKEGSYTNYLFDKGIDKILKKCGEEATEIVIAAKNPDAEELKYEISDFLYHMMVLMAECGLDWNDVVKELAHRR